MFNNIPPAGFPQIDLSQDVKRINAELSSMTSACTNIITDITAETATVTGNPITLSDALATDAISVVAEIEPSQDLHGYGKPWSGGSGKNKLPLVLADIKAENTLGTWSDNVYTYNGVDYAVNTDDNGNATSISTTGTPTINIAFSLTFDLPAGSYLCNGCPIGGSASTYSCVVKENDSSGSTLATDVGSGSSFSLSESTTIYYYIRLQNGYEVTDLTFYPMIRLATETDATFEPYTNICPISGMDSVTVTTTDGTDTNSATASLGTTIYGGSVDMTEGSASVTMANIASYDGETIGEPWLSSMDEYVSGATPTTGAQVVYTLATPTTLSLTPTTLAMLDGENTISTDAEEVSVEYIKNTLVGRVRRLEEKQ